MGYSTDRRRDVPLPGPDRTLPHSEEAERLVLGTVMGERGALDEVRGMLDADSFYVRLHRDIWRAIIELDAEGDDIDMVSVMARLNRDGSDATPADVVEVAGCHSYSVAQHAAIVHDKAIRRRFFDIGAYLTANCTNEGTDLLDVIERARTMLDDLLGHGRAPAATMSEALDEVLRRIEGNRSGGTVLTGARTGLMPFDARSGGLQRSDLVVVAGETSQGKTSLALSMTLEAGRPVAYYSLEMRKEQVAARMLSMTTGIAVRDIQSSPLTDIMLQRVNDGVQKLRDLPVYFDDRFTSNIDTIIESIRIMHNRYGIEGAVVDYLQILTVNRTENNKEQQMAEAARRLKNLARDLDIWIIALSQLNREGHSSPPALSRLRDSGQIAEAADIVMLVYRPEVYGLGYPKPFHEVSTAGTAMIDVAKGRNIGTFRFIAAFNAPTTRFGTLDTPRRAAGSTQLPF